MRRIVTAGLLFFAAGWAPRVALSQMPPALAPPPGIASATVFLTWDDDPTTTMTAQWLAASASEPKVHFRVCGFDSLRTITGSTIPFGDSPLDVARVRLKNLRPDTEYEFFVEGAKSIHRFRTAPAELTAPISFVSGGDAGPFPATEKTNVQAAKTNPLFALIGGDIAYANGSRVERWIHFIQMWHAQMRTSDGRLIPLLVCIGNHDTRGGYGRNREAAPFFYSLFALFREHGYAALDFGTYLSLILLDSGHTEAIDGRQKEWLASALLARRSVPHLFSAYHVSSLPTYHPFDHPTCALVRTHWVPLFEKFGVDVALEHHNHAYKRSPLIRDGAAAGDGVLYLGDGAWGANFRNPRTAADHWYLEASRGAHHFLLTTLGRTLRRHIAIDNDGHAFDSFPLPRLKLEMVNAPRRVRNASLFSSAEAPQVRILLPAQYFQGHPVAGLRASLAVLDRNDTRREERRFEIDAQESLTVELPPLFPGAYRLEASGVVTFHDDTVAQAFVYRDPRRFDVVDFTPRMPDDAVEFRSGVRYTRYEGSWRFLPSFDDLEPVAAGTAVRLDLAPAGDRQERFALVFRGFVSVPEDGLYEFYTRSDDGSRLTIGPYTVVENDGQHGIQERSGFIQLRAGCHAFSLEYFERRGDQFLEAGYRDPSGRRSVIDETHLFHAFETP